MKGIDLNKITSAEQLPKEALSRENPSIWERDITLGPAISLSERQRMYHLLSILLSSGLGIMDCMEVLLDQITQKQVKAIWGRIEEGLRSGKSLSDCMAEDEAHFSAFEIYSIRMGEQTGKMAEILKNLAALYEKQVRLKRKVIQALSYPIAVIIIAILVLSFMIAFVVPMFQDIFSRFDADLPPITNFILGISDFFQKQVGWIFLGLLLIIGLFLFIRRHPRFRSFTSKSLLRIPILGNLLLRLHLSRLCYTFSLLLSARVNMDQALALLEKVVTFYPLQSVFPQIRKQVIEGSTLYEAVQQHSIFPRFFTQIIKVGEKTAKLDTMLEKLAQSLEEESEAGISQITQFLEPILIIILGGMVALILISMYLPMFELSNAIG